MCSEWLQASAGPRASYPLCIAANHLFISCPPSCFSALALTYNLFWAGNAYNKLERRYHQDMHGQTTGISVLRKLRQIVTFEASLSYTVSSRPALTTLKKRLCQKPEVWSCSLVYNKAPDSSTTDSMMEVPQNLAHETVLPAKQKQRLNPCRLPVWLLAG